MQEPSFHPDALPDLQPVHDLAEEQPTTGLGLCLSGAATGRCCSTWEASGA